MKVKFASFFMHLFNNQVAYISTDWPMTARKFENDLQKTLLKDLIHPFDFKKSIYYDSENIRDYFSKDHHFL